MVSVAGELIVDELLGWIVQELGGVVMGVERTRQERAG